MEQIPFEERRRENLNVRDLIDERIRDFERRVNDTFQKAIDSLEKLVNLSVQTKSDALSIAISKMENGSSSCEKRCTAQVKEFYEYINKISKDNVGRDFLLDELTEEQEEALEDLKQFKVDVNLKIDNLTKSVSDFNSWKETFWVRNFVKTIAVTVFVTQILLKIGFWIVEKVPALQTLAN